MDYCQVVYAYEVWKQGSFSKAANVLFITQPAISHQIIALEQDLGCKLFIRDRNTIKLTILFHHFSIYSFDTGAGLDYHMKLHYSQTIVIPLSFFI